MLWNPRQCEDELLKNGVFLTAVAGPRNHRSQQLLRPAEAPPNRRPTVFLAASGKRSALPPPTRTLRADNADHRASFAPETIATAGNKHDRARQISGKINASDSCPDANNGLVAGSSPGEPFTISI